MKGDVILKKFLFIFSLIASFFFIHNVSALNGIYGDNFNITPESYQRTWNDPKQSFKILSNTNNYPVQILSTNETSANSIVVNLPSVFLNTSYYFIDVTLCSSANVNLTHLYYRNYDHDYVEVLVNSYLSTSQGFVYNNSWSSYCFSQTISIPSDTCDSDWGNCDGQIYRSIDIGAVFSGRGQISVAGLKVTNSGDNNIYEFIYFNVVRLLENIRSNFSNDINNGFQDSIDNTNKNHQEQMEQDQKNHDDMMNSDADSSFDQDTSSIDNYNKQEDELMGKLDVDTSDVNFDINSYSKPFKWIWDTITNFLNSSSKVIGCFVSFLVLSFVSLVIGRG